MENKISESIEDPIQESSNESASSSTSEEGKNSSNSDNLQILLPSHKQKLSKFYRGLSNSNNEPKPSEEEEQIPQTTKKDLEQSGNNDTTTKDSNNNQPTKVRKKVSIHETSSTDDQEQQNQDFKERSSSFNMPSSPKPAGRLSIIRKKQHSVEAPSPFKNKTENNEFKRSKTFETEGSNQTPQLRGEDVNDYQSIAQTCDDPDFNDLIEKDFGYQIDFSTKESSQAITDQIEIKPKRQPSLKKSNIQSLIDIKAEVETVVIELEKLGKRALIDKIQELCEYFHQLEVNLQKRELTLKEHEQKQYNPQKGRQNIYDTLNFGTITDYSVPKASKNPNDILSEILSETVNDSQFAGGGAAGLLLNEGGLGMSSTRGIPFQHQQSENKIHLAFLFSAPLVLYVQDMNQNVTKKPVYMQVDYETERTNIKSILVDSEQDIKFRSYVGTQAGLADCLNSKPRCMHFCGHGLKNKGSMGLNNSGDEGDFLVFEDEESNQVDFLSCKALRGLLREKKLDNEIDFVFVASCHSSLVGKVFLDAGAKHVICVDRNEKILDKACQEFTKFFYSAYFNADFTVCEAFKNAKEHLKSIKDLPFGEVYKFKLLSKHDVYYSAQCSKFLADPGTFQDVTPISFFSKSIPSRVENFQGRHADIHDIIKLINDNRFIILKGVPGIGKSSLSKEVANYIYERNKFRDGVIYCNLTGIDSIEEVLSHFEIAIDFPNKDLNVKRRTVGRIAQYIYDSIKTEGLLILDGIDQVFHKEGKKMRELLEMLLRKCSKLKILVSTCAALGNFQDVTEKVYKISHLNPYNSVVLLLARAPRTIPEKEIKELLEYELTQSEAEAANINKLFQQQNRLSIEQRGRALSQNQNDNQFMGLTSYSSSNDKSLENHHVIQLLGGHPGAISLAAGLLLERSLLDLYRDLLANPILSLVKEDGFTEDEVESMNSMQVSLDASLNHLKASRGPEILKMFGLFGLLPGGAREPDLETLWGPSWFKLASILLSHSLIIKQEGILGIRYAIYPFMVKYAEQRLDKIDQESFVVKIQRYLCKKAREILTKIGNVNLDSSKYFDVFSLEEVNFKACLTREVNRLMNSGKIIYEEEYFEDTWKMDVQQGKNIEPQLPTSPKSTTATPLISRKFVEDNEIIEENEEAEKKTASDRDSLSQPTLRPSESKQTTLTISSGPQQDLVQNAEQEVDNALKHKKFPIIGNERLANSICYKASKKGPDSRLLLNSLEIDEETEHETNKEEEVNEEAIPIRSLNRKLSNATSKGENRLGLNKPTLEKIESSNSKNIQNTSSTLSQKRMKINPENIQKLSGKNTKAQKVQQQLLTQITESKFKKRDSLNEEEQVGSKWMNRLSPRNINQQDKFKFPQKPPSPRGKKYQDLDGYINSGNSLEDGGGSSSDQNTAIKRKNKVKKHQRRRSIRKNSEDEGNEVDDNDSNSSIESDSSSSSSNSSSSSIKTKGYSEYQNEVSDTPYRKGNYFKQQREQLTINLFDKEERKMSIKGEEEEEFYMITEEIYQNKNINVELKDEAASSSKMDSEFDKKSMTHDSIPTGKRFRKRSTHSSIRAITGMDPVCKLSIYYCSILLCLKRYTECEKALIQALKIAKGNADLMAEANVLKIKGCLLMVERKFDQALIAYKEAYDIFNMKNSLSGSATCIQAIAYINGIMKQENLEQSIKDMEQAIQHFKERKEYLKMSISYRWLGIMAKSQGLTKEKIMYYYKESNSWYKTCSNLLMKTNYTIGWMSDPLKHFLEIAERSNDKYYRMRGAGGMLSRISSDRGSDQDSVIGLRLFKNGKFKQKQVEEDDGSQNKEFRRHKSACEKEINSKVKLMPCHTLKKRKTCDYYQKTMPMLEEMEMKDMKSKQQQQKISDESGDSGGS